MTDDLSSSFAGLDPVPLSFHKFALVGAETGEYDGLSLTDVSLLRSVNKTIEDRWKLGEFLPEGRTVDVINLHEEHGGLDFLKETVSTDVLVFCNIPEDVEEQQDIVRRFENDPDPDVQAMVSNIRKSFRSSVDHKDKTKWRDKILESGAKVVFLYGSDSFKSEDLIGDEFIPVPRTLTDNHVVGVFVRRDYLHDAYTYFLVNGKPLLDLADKNLNDHLNAQPNRPNGFDKK